MINIELFYPEECNVCLEQSTCKLIDTCLCNIDICEKCISKLKTKRCIFCREKIKYFDNSKRIYEDIDIYDRLAFNQYIEILEEENEDNIFVPLLIFNKDLLLNSLINLDTEEYPDNETEVFIDIDNKIYIRQIE